MIGIVDYKAGNLTSVRLALESLNIACKVSDHKEELLSCDRLIFPGVGAAGSAMQQLLSSQLHLTLQKFLDLGKPVLGICLGTQIILESSEEDGGVSCLGILPGRVKKFNADHKIKIPHMGWNSIQILNPHPLFRGIDSGTFFYFVHSYYPCPLDLSLNIAQTEYGTQLFTSAMGKANLFAVQFHPEKSGPSGLSLLKNFSEWDGNPIC